jgi:hypothetical protein
MVILFVSADVLVLYIYNKLRRRRRPASTEPVEVAAA